MIIDKWLGKMVEAGGSDLFLRAKSFPKIRLFGEVVNLEEKELEPSDLVEIIKELLTQEEFNELSQKKSYEGAFYFRENWRMRISIFYQRNSLALVIRAINLNILSFEELNLPSKVLKSLCEEKRGLVLLTGTTGSGKSTAIASMIEYINKNHRRHILSIEEPIEFTFTDKNSIINQREIGKDVDSYLGALRQFALHSPDVIFIGNIRDEETMRAALDAAETGVLVFSTLHTVNASQTVERIISFFPPYQHPQVLMQLSQLLKGVVSLRLLPSKDGKSLIPAYEVMVLSPSISRLIRENKIWEIPSYIEQGEIYGMVSFEQMFLKLVKEGKVNKETAISFSDKKEELRMRIENE
ncbi:MAG TPA: PilT/PilU family type 4a pilus ATPase [Candidatus Omnitrophica bacterium]|nr:MAG: type IV pili twitching motility protein PilT [Candidatus Omnitrophota bacterium]RKY44476.1 MAG: type IV pili twitching motility protein PilT [Candidatus Omnitrophota bacterium]HEC69904.1 PilT/PilU family type 4a pilus ATPase [Candidatus Omnitrophota bacterium]